MRVLVSGVTAVLVLAGCTSDDAEQAAPTTPAPAVTGPIDESALVRTTLGLNDATRTTDPTPASPGDDAVPGRNLPSTVIYPDVEGSLPVVVFTHGLGSEPAAYDELLTAWALAGFLVVAPHHPLTVAGSAQVFDDVVNQPADVSFVLDGLLALNETVDDPLEGRIDVDHVAVAGHSAGAITTLGLLSDCCTDDRIGAAVVLAGSPLFFGGEIAASDVPVLFVHPTADTVLPIEQARAVFQGDPGPAAFLELTGATHSAPFDSGGDPAYPAVEAATTDFLRWALLDDDDALGDLRDVPAQWPVAVLAEDRLPR